MIPTKEVAALRAFHKNPDLKKQLVAEVQKHQKADQIARRTYGEVVDGKWRGCAVGCSIHSLNIRLGKDIPTSQHSAYPAELGIPEALAHLEDYLFEAMPADKAMRWPAEFMKAVPVGADLSLVAAKFICAVLKDVVKLRYVKDDNAVVKAVLDTAELWARVVNGEVVKETEWSAAESAARSAARSAAESAAAYKMSRTLLKLLKNSK